MLVTDQKEINGIPQTTLLFVEAGRDGSSLPPKSFTICGKMVHVAAQVIRFDPQFVKDNEACARQAELDQRKFGGGELDSTHATYNRMYDACMRASGYQRKQKDAK